MTEKASCRGIGLHSGVPIEMTLEPARADTGIVFVRRDAAGPCEVPAFPSAVSGTSHATTLASPGNAAVRVTTVEHLLSALYIHGICNLRVQLSGPEVPALDGSAHGLVQLIHSAGVFEQPEAQGTLCIRKPLEVRDGRRRIRVDPCDELSVHYAVEFDHPAIGRQELDLPRVDAALYDRELAPARTFGFLHEVSELLRAGLAQGGSLENTVVLDEERVLNTRGLRFPDEFVRHKVVDLFGDLALLGLPLRGRLSVERGGHALHQMLVRAIVENPDAWEVEGAGALPPAGLALTRAPS